jgi:hypothetical protein
MQKRRPCQRMSLEWFNVFFLLLFKSNVFNVSNLAVSWNAWCVFQSPVGTHGASCLSCQVWELIVFWETIATFTVHTSKWSCQLVSWKACLEAQRHQVCHSCVHSFNNYWAFPMDPALYQVCCEDANMRDSLQKTPETCWVLKIYFITIW